MLVQLIFPLSFTKLRGEGLLCSFDCFIVIRKAILTSLFASIAGDFGYADDLQHYWAVHLPLFLNFVVHQRITWGMLFLNSTVQIKMQSNTSQRIVGSWERAKTHTYLKLAVLKQKRLGVTQGGPFWVMKSILYPWKATSSANRTLTLVWSSFLLVVAWPLYK